VRVFFVISIVAMFFNIVPAFCWEMATFTGEMRMKGDGTFKDKVTLYFAQGDFGISRSVKYYRSSCIFDLELVDERTWAEVRPRNGEDCNEVGGDYLKITPEKHGELQVERLMADRSSYHIQAKLFPTNFDYSDYCAPYPASCNIWEAVSLERLKQLALEARRRPNPSSALAQEIETEDNGLRKPLVDDWKNCGRPFVFDEELPQDTTLRYKAFAFTCLKASHITSHEWKLRIADLNFGEGFEIEGAKLGMLLDGIGSEGRGIYSFGDMLIHIAKMKVGDTSKIYLQDLNKKCAEINCQYLTTKINRR